MKKFNRLIITSLMLFFSLSSTAQDLRSPLIPTSSWSAWTLHLINLDKNDKPNGEQVIDLSKSAIVKHKNLSISIFPDELDPNSGKVVRFSCPKSDLIITQKFGSPDQLKGFALQMSCTGQKYYFIVNPRT